MDVNKTYYNSAKLLRNKDFIIHSLLLPLYCFIFFVLNIYLFKVCSNCNIPNLLKYVFCKSLKKSTVCILVLYWLIQIKMAYKWGYK